MSKNKWPEQSTMYEDLRSFVATLGTQKKAAEKLGVSEVMVSEIMLRKRPIPRSVARVIGYHKVVTWVKGRAQ